MQALLVNVSTQTRRCARLLNRQDLVSYTKNAPFFFARLPKFLPHPLDRAKIRRLRFHQFGVVREEQAVPRRFPRPRFRPGQLALLPKLRLLLVSLLILLFLLLGL